MEENGKEGPPVFLDGLDELDRKIVRLLIGNARISYSDLGAQVGISRVGGPHAGAGAGKKRALLRNIPPS